MARGWLLSPVIGAGTGGLDGSPIRAQVFDREAEEGDRLEAVGPGVRDKCIVAFDVNDPSNLGDHGGELLLDQDELDVSAGQVRRVAQLESLARSLKTRRTGSSREVLRAIGRALDPNFHEGGHLGSGRAPRRGSFADDAFTDTEGTALQSHTPTGSGGSWVQHASLPNGMEIASNRARGNTNSQICYYVSADPATAEYDLAATVRCFTQASSELFLSARIETGAITFYYAGVSVATARISKRVAGANTALSSAAVSVTNGTDYEYDFEVRNAAKKFYRDSVEIISTSDNAITAKGKVGTNQFGVAASDTVGYHMDSFTATDAMTRRRRVLLGVGT